MSQAFPDHFSPQAADYARHRPGYPAALFAWLAAAAPARGRAWDCATGSGQAALALADHFDAVVASDGSLSQVRHAALHPRVDYLAATAESSGLAAGSVDLVTVAQALHWFRFEPFYAEVRRVLRPGGLLAVWSYELLTIDPAIDEVVNRFYRGLDPWWPPERRHVENGYRDLPFPFEALNPPPFEMSAAWPLEGLRGYLATWSAVRHCREQTGADPLAALDPELAAVWGDPAQVRQVTWPLNLRVGRAR